MFDTVETLHAVGDDSWAKAPHSNKATLMQSRGFGLVGRGLDGDRRVLTAGKGTAPTLESLRKDTGFFCDWYILKRRIKIMSQWQGIGTRWSSRSLPTKTSL